MGALADTWMWILSADAIREYADSLAKGCKASPDVDELSDELVRFTTYVPELRAEWRNYFGHISKVGKGNARDDLHLVPGEAYLIDDVVDGGAPSIVMDHSAIRNHPGYERHYTPQSDWIRDALRGHLIHVVPDEGDYDDLLDDVEYLIGLQAWYATSRFAPIGRFGWRNSRYGLSVGSPRDLVVTQYTSELLDSGLCGGDRQALLDAHSEYEAYVDANPFRG
jgi:hypothetical protein